MTVGFFNKLHYVNPRSLPSPRGFSNGLYLPVYGPHSGILFIAGQIGCDAKGHIVSATFAAQFDQALINVISVVEGMRGRPEAIGKLTIFVTDMQAYLDARKEIGVSYRQRMGKHYPAMSLVEVKSLVNPDAFVEIEGIALV